MGTCIWLGHLSRAIELLGNLGLGAFGLRICDSEILFTPSCTLGVLWVLVG